MYLGINFLTCFTAALESLLHRSVTGKCWQGRGYSAYVILLQVQRKPKAFVPAQHGSG